MCNCQELFKDNEHWKDCLLTLQNIKDQYYADLALVDTERRGLEEYIRDEYVQVYDDKLSFIGYEKK